MAAIVKDLGKRSSDLLKKDLPTAENPSDFKIEWKGKTPSGVELEANLTNGSALSGTFKPKYKWASLGNVEVSGELDTKGLYKAEVAVTDEFVKGLKSTVTAESSEKATFATFGFEFRHERGSATGSADYGKEKGSLLQGSASVVPTAGFALGASAKYFVGAPANKLTEFQALLSYASKDQDLVLFHRTASSDKDAQKQEVGVSFYHNASGDLQVGGELARDLGAQSTLLKLGSKWSPSSDSAFKATFATSGLLAVSFQQKFNQRATGTVGFVVDTTSVTKNSSQFAVTLSVVD